MVKSVEDTTRNYARKSLMAFLDGEKTLNWIIGVIRSSGVRGSRLTEIFENLRGYEGNPVRYQEARTACREQGWLN